MVQLTVEPAAVPVPVPTADLPRGPEMGVPLSPDCAWGLLDLLDGGDAAWLEPGARDDVVGHIARLADAPASQWEAALADRSLVVNCWANPQALAELDQAPGEVVYLARRASEVVGAVEIYADLDAWMQIQPRVLIGAEVRGPMNLLARVPQGHWPFRDGAVGPAARAADALEHPDPAVAAQGEATLHAAAATFLATRA